MGIVLVLVLAAPGILDEVFDATLRQWLKLLP
jgi:hypothetical protein